MQFETRPVGDGVYEIRNVETGDQFLINVNTMQTSIQLDELTRTALMAALEEFGIVVQDNGTYMATERGSQSAPPKRVQREQLSGKAAWDAQFGKKGTPDWVSTVGGSWGSSPSGWNNGGWQADPGPSMLYQLKQQGYSDADAHRIMNGYEPVWGENLLSLNELTLDQSRQMVAEIENALNSQVAPSPSRPVSVDAIRRASDVDSMWAKKNQGLMNRKPATELDRKVTPGTARHGFYGTI